MLRDIAENAAAVTGTDPGDDGKEFDVFISHATEDKGSVVPAPCPRAAREGPQRLVRRVRDAHRR